MITSHLKHILLLGTLVATVFGVLRLIQDGEGGEIVATTTFNTACLLFTGAAVLHAIEERKPPPKE